MNRIAVGRCSLSSLSAALLACAGVLAVRVGGGGADRVTPLRPDLPFRSFLPVPRKRKKNAAPVLRFLGRPEGQAVYVAKPHLAGLCRRRLYNRNPFGRPRFAW